MFMQRRGFCIIVLTILTTLSGCSLNAPPEGKGDVQGSVTYKGEPVRNAQVELYAAEIGSGALVETDSEGKFTVSAPILVGTYKVAVGPIPPGQGEMPDPNKKMSPDLPKKLRDVQTSGLTVTVVEGENDVKLELVD